MLVKTNGCYGAKVGHRQVFTKEGAIECYKLFLQVCYIDHEFLMAESVALSQVEDDMVRIGFTREELEQIEIDFLESMRCSA